MGPLFGAPILGTYLGNLYGHLCGAPMWDNYVGHLCGTHKWDVYLGHLYGSQKWVTYMGHLYGAPMWASAGSHLVIRYGKNLKISLPVPSLSLRSLPGSSSSPRLWWSIESEITLVGIEPDSANGVSSTDVKFTIGVIDVVVVVFVVVVVVIVAVVVAVVDGCDGGGGVCFGITTSFSSPFDVVARSVFMLLSRVARSILTTR